MLPKPKPEPKIPELGAVKKYGTQNQLPSLNELIQKLGAYKGNQGGITQEEINSLKRGYQTGGQAGLTAGAKGWQQQRQEASLLQQQVNTAMMRDVNTLSPFTGNERPTATTGISTKTYQGYWENPYRVARYYDLIQQMPDTWVAPEWLDVPAIEAAYKYLSFKNNNEPWVNWETPSADDPVIGLLQSLPVPPVSALTNEELLYLDPKVKAEQERMADPYAQYGIEPVKSYDELPWYGKLQLIMSGAGAGPPDRPQFSKDLSNWATGILPALAASHVGAIVVPLAAAAVGVTVAPLVGALIAGGVVLTTLAMQNITGEKVPVIGDIFAGMNYLGQQTETGGGILELAEAEGLDKVLKNYNAAKQVGAGAYEVGTGKYSGGLYGAIAGGLQGGLPGAIIGAGAGATAGSVNWSKELTDLAAILSGDEPAGPDEVWNFSQGYAEPVPVMNRDRTGVGPIGQKALVESFNRIIDENEDPVLVMSDMVSRFGDTGTLNNFIGQSLYDPIQFFGYFVDSAGGALTAKGAKLLAIAEARGGGSDFITSANLATLSKSFEMQKGNPLIEAMPIGAQQLATYFTGLKASGGLLPVIKDYQNWVLNGIEPTSVTGFKYAQKVPPLPVEEPIVYSKPIEFVLDSVEGKNGVISYDTELPSSISKTAKTIGTILTENKISTDQPIEKALAEFRASRPRIKQVIPENVVPADQTNYVLPEKMSQFDRVIANLSREGLPEEFLPKDKGTGIAARFNRLVSLEPKDAAIIMNGNFASSVGLLVKSADNPELDIMSRAQIVINVANRYSTGEGSGDVGNIASRIFGSPYASLGQQAMKLSADTGWPKEMYKSLETSTPKIIKIQELSNLLTEPEGKVVTPVLFLSNLASNQETVFKMLKAKGITDFANADALTKFFDPFLGGKSKNGKLKDMLPATFEEWQSKFLANMFDQSSKAFAKYYNLGQDKTFWRYADVLKQVQNILLLDTNLGFPVRNFLNDVPSRAVNGVWQNYPMERIMAWMDEFGSTPPRFKEGYTMTSGGSEFGDINAGIKAAVESKDFMSKAMGGVRKFRKSFGFASNFSQTVEMNESARAFGIGMINYWNKYWTFDNGASKMPADLEQSLSKIDPGLPGLVKDSVLTSKNPTQLEYKLLSKQILKLDIDSLIGNGIEKLRPGDADGLKQLAGEFGLDAKDSEGNPTGSAKELADADTPQKLAVAIDKIKRRIDNVMEAKLADKLNTVMEQSQVEILQKGPVAVAQAIQNAFKDELDGMSNKMFEDDILYRRIADYDQPNKSLEITAHNEKQSKFWKDMRAKNLGIITGTLKAFGFDSPVSKAVIDLWQDTFKADTEFYEIKQSLLKNFFDNYNKESAGSEWAKVQENIRNAAVARQFRRTNNLQSIYTITADLFKDADGKPNADVLAYGQVSADIMGKQFASIDAFYKLLNQVRMEGAEPAEINALWDKFNKETYVKLAAELYAAENSMSLSGIDGIPPDYSTLSPLDNTPRAVIERIGRAKALTDEFGDLQSESYKQAEAIFDNPDIGSKPISELTPEEINILHKADIDLSAQKEVADVFKSIRDQAVSGEPITKPITPMEGSILAQTAKPLAPETFKPLAPQTETIIGIDKPWEMPDEQVTALSKTPDSQVAKPTDAESAKWFKDNPKEQFSVDNIFDIDYLTKKYSINIDQAVADVAGRLGDAEATRFALTAAHQALGGEVPPDILAKYPELENIPIDKSIVSDMYKYKVEAVPEVVQPELPVSEVPPVAPLSEKQLSYIALVQQLNNVISTSITEKNKAVLIPPTVEVFVGNKPIAMDTRPVLLLGGAKETSQADMWNIDQQKWNDMAITQLGQFPDNYGPAVFKVPKDTAEVAVKPYDKDGLLITRHIVKGKKQTVVALQDSTYTPDVIQSDVGTFYYIGLDPAHANSYVYMFKDKVYSTFDAQKDFAVPAKPIQGVAPMDAKLGYMNDYDAMAEMKNRHFPALMDQIEREIISNFGKKTFSLADADEVTNAQMLKWVRQLETDMPSAKLATMRYGEYVRDAALLNYNRQYGGDKILSLYAPYEFWATRTAWNWAGRMIDHPSWFAMYARYRELQQKMEQKGVPTRMIGKIKFPAPFLQDWMGGNLYFDPLKDIFPPATYDAIFGQLGNQDAQISRAAKQILYKKLDNKEITQQELDDAILNMKGYIWESALSQAGIENESKVDPMSLLSMTISPALYLDIPMKIAAGTPEKIGTLPGTRQGLALQAALSDTPLKFLGDMAAGVLAGPEVAVRKAAGLSNYNEWGPYYMDRQLSNMATEPGRDVNAVLQTMIEKKGPLFDEASNRVAQEMSMKIPGVSAIYLLKALFTGRLDRLEKVGLSAVGLFTTVFSSTILPEGELKQRGLYENYIEAIKKSEAGDSKAINKFFDDYPEYKARLALYDKPEERLRQFLVSQIWDQYYKIPQANKTFVNDQLGDLFKTAFLSTQTRSYESIDVGSLAYWAKVLKATVPDTEQTAAVTKMPQAVLPTLTGYPPQLAAAIQAYKSERNKKYPNYYALQTEYYENGRSKSFLSKFPELKEYFNWNRKYKASHPEMKAYWDEQAAKQETPQFGENRVPIEFAPEEVSENDLKKIDPILVKQLTYYFYGNTPLTSGAEKELTRLWNSWGKPGGTIDYFLDNVLRNSFVK